MNAPHFSAADLAAALEQFPPTEEQVSVIEAPLEPMLVIAGAGSGKTETMAAKVVYLVANQMVEPSQVLGLTFTRKAAGELSTRVRQRLATIAQIHPGIDLSTPPRISTYNSYAAGIVNDHGLRMGVDPAAALISEAGRYQLAEDIVNTWPGDLDTTMAASSITTAVTALAGEISEHGLTTTRVRQFLARMVSELQSKAPEGRSKQPRSEIRTYISRMENRIQLMDLVDEFAARKSERGVVDFGDQVRTAAELAANFPVIGAGERATYKVVLLDEYQDTSIAQVQLLSALFGGGHAVTAVGDPNQAIYGWRGAAAGTLTDFPQTFTSARGSASIATLTTAWRNSTDILDVANKIAAPLRRESEVPELQPAPKAKSGQVQVFYGQTIDAETQAIVEHLTNLGWPGQAPPTSAILVRARRLFTPIAQALTAAGIPHHISGIGGLLHTPEVADLRAALTVLHDPSRADALMRLLTGPRLKIGPRDLLILNGWAKELARDRTQSAAQNLDSTASGPADSDRSPANSDSAPAVTTEDVEAASIVEALEHLPPRTYHPRGSTYTLSDEARSRLTTLAETLRYLRTLTHLPVPDMVAATEHALGLDIDVLAYREVGTARENLDSFAHVATSFTSGVHASDLGGFLAWLEAAEEHERGLDQGSTDPDPGVVHMMTIHAAKGLEWDNVIVAGMGEGLFPSTAPRKDGTRSSTGWLGSNELLPYDLRGDKDNLPSFDHEQAETHAQMKEVNEAFCAEEGNRELNEERRLAYVALTRAKTHLLLTGSFWVPGRATPYDPSVFLLEATRAGVETGELSLIPDDEENPLVVIEHPVAWPPPYALLPAAPQPQGDISHPLEETDPDVANWYTQARLLLAERERSLDPPTTAIEHLSASRVVAAARDPEEFSRNQRRPIPSEPSDRARQGTQFHSWVEQHFNSPALLDWDLLPGADDDDDEGDAQQLQETFLNSTWANRDPVALETDVETTISGVRIRSRIDAVFLDPDGSYHVVDWKTGRIPQNKHEERARMNQLLLYRLAWARAKGVDVREVRASFYYVPQDTTVPAPPMGEAEIITHISEHIADIS